VNSSSGLTVGDFFQTMRRDLPVTGSSLPRRVWQVSITQDRTSRIEGRQVTPVKVTNGAWLFVEGLVGPLCVINFPDGMVLVAGEKPR